VRHVARFYGRAAAEERGTTTLRWARAGEVQVRIEHPSAAGGLRADRSPRNQPRYRTAGRCGHRPLARGDELLRQGKSPRRMRRREAGRTKGVSGAGSAERRCACSVTASRSVLQASPPQRHVFFPPDPSSASRRAAVRHPCPIRKPSPRPARRDRFRGRPSRSCPARVRSADPPRPAGGKIQWRARLQCGGAVLGNFCGEAGSCGRRLSARGAPGTRTRLSATHAHPVIPKRTREGSRFGESRSSIRDPSGVPFGMTRFWAVASSTTFYAPVLVK
jgi:hypothetical protein